MKILSATKQEIFSYYLSDEFKPELPGVMRFRHFRIRDAEGGWRKIPSKIHTKEDLVKWIIKRGALDVYYSTSKWYNPHLVSKKGEFGSQMVADNLLLDNDLVFDIDAEEPITIESLEKAKLTTKIIHQIMKQFESRYKLEYLSWTGCKGFRLSYEDTQLSLPEHPLHRLEYLDQERKLFIERLLLEIEEKSPATQKRALGQNLDKKITLNPLCVVRLLGTVHSSTGFISTRIPVSRLNRSIEFILSQIPYVGKARPVIPHEREMTKDGGRSTPRPQLEHRGMHVSGLTCPPLFPPDKKYFMTNKVLGIKRGFIPFFTYQKNQKYYQKELERLQEKHQLGHIYIYDDGEKYCCIALKVMQRRQLQKVLNESSSKAKYDFNKYHRIFVPFLMEKIAVLRGVFKGHLSKGHKAYVSPGKRAEENI